MSEAIASVPLKDDLSSTSDRVSIGFNDLERLAHRYKQENPSMSDEEAKNQALQQLLRDAARNGTPSVTEHANANARQPSESSYRRGMRSAAQPTMPIRGPNQNSAGHRTSHAPSPSKPINPTRQLGYSPYPPVKHRPSVPKPPTWNQPQFPPHLGQMDFGFSPFIPQRVAYTPQMSPQQSSAMLTGGSSFPTSDTRSYGAANARNPNDMRFQQENGMQGMPRRINTATIRDAKTENVEKWINTDLSPELEKPELPPTPSPSTSTEQSLVDLTVSGTETANSSPQNLTTIQSPPRAGPTQTTQSQDTAQKPKRRRQRPREPVKCEEEKCNRTFSSPHELRRHHKREHDNEKWIIVDITADKRLKGCKRCDTGHIYGAKYNATAHLKRKHVNLRKRKEGQLELECPHPELQPKEFTQYANKFVQPKKAADTESDSEDGNVSDIDTFAAQMQHQSSAPIHNRPHIEDYMDNYHTENYFTNTVTPQYTAQQATYISPNYYTQFSRKQERGELLEQFTTGSGTLGISNDADIFSMFGAANSQALGQSLTMPTSMPDFSQAGNMVPSTMYNAGAGEAEAEFSDFSRTLVDKFSTTGMLADVDLNQMSEMGVDFFSEMFL